MEHCTFSVSIGVAAINIAAETGDVHNLMNCLGNHDVFLHSVTPECAELYMTALMEAKQSKAHQGSKDFQSLLDV